jgi:thiol-disulfide isomerase/thioredoxin
MNLLKQCLTSVILLLSLQVIAQEKLKRLYVGDKVPNIEFRGIFNYPTKTAKLSDFKGKAVILDFWNKNCKACMAAFPKMQQLQEVFKDDLMILLINDNPKETRESLEPLFKKSPILKDITLPMVFGDENFGNKSEMFPHYGVPYHVWIDKSGIIQATTIGPEATTENIKKLINGEVLSITKREDIVEDLPVGTNWLNYNDGQFLNNLLYYKSSNFTYNCNREYIDLKSLSALKLDQKFYSFFMKPVFGGLKAVQLGSFYDSNNKVTGNTLVDMPLSRLFYDAYYNIYPVRNPILIIDANDALDLSTKYIYAFTHSDYSDILFRNTLKNDLKDFFGFTAEVEMRNIESYILYRTNKALNIVLSKQGGDFFVQNSKSKRGAVIQNGRISSLTSLFFRETPEDKFGNHTPVLDETGIDPNAKFDITIYGSLHSISTLNQELNKYGLGIKKAHRMLPVLVLHKVK